jgi:hypothetical protein
MNTDNKIEEQNRSREILRHLASRRVLSVSICVNPWLKFVFL